MLEEIDMCLSASARIRRTNREQTVSNASLTPGHESCLRDAENTDVAIHSQEKAKEGEKYNCDGFYRLEPDKNIEKNNLERLPSRTFERLVPHLLRS